MCGNHAVKLGRNLDPTNTTVIRQQFASKMAKRYDIIEGLTHDSIVDKNCFNISVNMAVLEDDSLSNLDPSISPIEYIHTGTPTEQTEEFMGWLNNMEREILFQDRIGSGGLVSYWFYPYMLATARKALLWARANIIRSYRKAGDVEKASDIDVKQSSIDVRAYDPDIEDLVQESWYRVLNGLEGINDASNQAIRRSLLDGLRAGWSPDKIAAEITTHLEGIGSYRAQMLARTEIIRAHHLVSIEEYRQAGIKGVKVQAEFTTARDGRVCPICASLDYKQTGKLWLLDEIETVIPVHPLCRCAALPVVQEEEE